MPALGAFANVFNTALVILEKKGFRVWTNDTEEEWFAEREGWDFMTDDPIQLLGLVAIYEYQQPTEFREYWWQHQQPWLVESVSKTPPAYKPVYDRRV